MVGRVTGYQLWIGDHFNNPLAPSTFTHEASATIRGFSTGLFDPVGIALDSNGNIYVANDEGSSAAPIRLPA